VKKYFVVIFAFFSGLELIGFLSGGLIPSGGFDYLLSLFFGIIIPIIVYGVRDTKGSYLRVPIYCILVIVVLRFVLDGFVHPTITPGPWRIYVFVGLSYAMYFVLRQKIHKDNVHQVIKYFITVATFVSVISIMQVLFPFLPLFGGSRSFDAATEVGDEFIRFQTTFYHGSVLAIMLIISLLITQPMNISRRLILVAACFSNFATVMIAGYRATMYVCSCWRSLNFLLT